MKFKVSGNDKRKPARPKKTRITKVRQQHAVRFDYRSITPKQMNLANINSANVDVKQTNRQEHRGCGGIYKTQGQRAPNTTRTTLTRTAVFICYCTKSTVKTAEVGYPPPLGKESRQAKKDASTNLAKSKPTAEKVFMEHMTRVLPQN